MNPKTQGIFLFYEWIDHLGKLPPKTAMTIIGNLLVYHRDDILPPPLRGSAGIVQDILIEHMKRQKQAAFYGRMGAEAKRAQALRNAEENEDADAKGARLSQ